MKLFVLAYISNVSWRGKQKLCAVLGNDFSPGPIPSVLGPFATEEIARDVVKQLLEIDNWGADDDVLLAGPPGVPMSVADAFNLVREHSAWGDLAALYGRDALEGWLVAAVPDERCVAITVASPDGGIGAASCFVVDREYRRVFPRFTLPLWTYVDRHASVRCRASDLGSIGA